MLRIYICMRALRCACSFRDLRVPDLDDEFHARRCLAPRRALVEAGKVVLSLIRLMIDEHARVRPGSGTPEAHLVRHTVALSRALVERGEESLPVRLGTLLDDAPEVRAVALVSNRFGTRSEALSSFCVRALRESRESVLLRVRLLLRDFAVARIRARPAEVLAEDGASFLALHKRRVETRQGSDFMLGQNAAMCGAEAVVAPAVGSRNGEQGEGGAHVLSAEVLFAV